jgi:hypothetical protein
MCILLVILSSIALLIAIYSLYVDIKDNLKKIEEMKNKLKD